MGLSIFQPLIYKKTLDYMGAGGVKCPLTNYASCASRFPYNLTLDLKIIKIGLDL